MSRAELCSIEGKVNYTIFLALTKAKKGSGLPGKNTTLTPRSPASELIKLAKRLRPKY